MAHQHILGAALKGVPASQCAVCQHPQGVYVGAGVHRATGDLLGGHVVGRADQGTGGGEAGRVESLGDAEVGQYHLWLAGGRLAEEDVAGLNVAMDHPVAVGVVEGVGHRPEDLAERVGGEGAVAQDPLIERLAIEQLHGDVGHAIVLADIVDRHNVWVFQGRRRHRLTGEALDQGLIIAVLGEEDLQGYIALEYRIGGTIDGGHTATAQQLLDQVATEVLVDEGSQHAIRPPVRLFGCLIGILT